MRDEVRKLINDRLGSLRHALSEARDMREELEARVEGVRKQIRLLENEISILEAEVKPDEGGA